MVIPQWQCVSSLDNNVPIEGKMSSIVIVRSQQLFKIYTSLSGDIAPKHYP